MTDIAIRHHQIPLASMPQGISPLRIAQLSDFHFRHWTRLLDRLQRRLARMTFDLLALTGDFSQHPRDGRHAARLLCRFLEPIRPPLGCYAVAGNHDAAILADTLADGPVSFLRNESVEVRRNGHAVNIAGLDDGVRSVADLPKTLAGCRNGRLTILLCHLPSTHRHLPDGVVDLVLSGHTHAGQWRLPWLGCLKVNDRISREQIHGLHRIGPRWLHVTAGVGASGPFHFRINCPSEIALLTLTRPTAHNVAVP